MSVRKTKKSHLFEQIKNKNCKHDCKAKKGSCWSPTRPLFRFAIINRVSVVPCCPAVRAGVRSKHGTNNPAPAIFQLVSGIELWRFPVVGTETTHCLAFPLVVLPASVGVAVAALAGVVEAERSGWNGSGRCNRCGGGGEGIFRLQYCNKEEKR